MYNAAIIGAGQLGSRHLQGLKTASLPFKIWVMDKSEESLNIAKQRYDSVAAIGEKEIVLASDIEQLPESLDFVVVATGSISRASIVKTLLNHSQVKYMVLEKVLFPKLDEYDEIESLIEKNGVKCWVNCARRMFGVYHEIKQILGNSSFEMQYEGANWGLCCNSIHFIDIFMMLNGESEYSIDTNHLEPKVYNSKRNGYIELYGSLTVRTPKGSVLKLTCCKDADLSTSYSICNNEQQISLEESRGILDVNGKKYSFRLPFQSETTGIYADMILKTGHCSLTPFRESCNIHRIYVSELLGFYNRVIGENTDILPIT